MDLELGARTSDGDSHLSALNHSPVATLRSRFRPDGDGGSQYIQLRARRRLAVGAPRQSERGPPCGRSQATAVDAGAGASG